MTATARLLAGNRLHLQHGPIDLIIGAEGTAPEVACAYRAAALVFPGILPTLVAELEDLRAPTSEIKEAFDGPVARRMAAAVWPYRSRFITPMAAVAGSVADEVLGVLCATANLRRAYVNNGGDIAIHLTHGATFAVGVVGDLAVPAINARLTIRPEDGIGGMATSGWRGRSQSLGIADAVTVLATTAAAADAAATMIANAVDIDDPAIERRPAREVKCDSDLGVLPVTVAVGPLAPGQLARALDAGVARAREILSQQLIVAAYIQLQSGCRTVDARALGLQAA